MWGEEQRRYTGRADAAESAACEDWVGMEVVWPSLWRSRAGVGRARGREGGGYRYVNLEQGLGMPARTLLTAAASQPQIQPGMGRCGCECRALFSSLGFLNLHM